MALDPHVQGVIDDYEKRQNAAFAFLRENLDSDVAVGALRLLSGHLPETCQECGATCDYALGVYCSCWSEITPENKPDWLAFEDDPDDI